MTAGVISKNDLLLVTELPLAFRGKPLVYRHEPLAHFRNARGMNKQQIAKALMTAVAAGFWLMNGAAIRENVSQRDFMAYWSAARLLLKHASPYDQHAVIELERSVGYKENRPLVVRTPPWSLFLFLPLGFLPAWPAWLLWLGLSVMALAVSVRKLKALLGIDTKDRRRFTILTYTFAPVLGCLMTAQIGTFLLLGFVLFLTWCDSRPRLAGAVLILLLAKPQLFILLIPAFVLWIVMGRRWKVLEGLGAAFLMTTLVAVSLDPSIFSHYRSGMLAEDIQALFIPNAAGVLRVLLHQPFMMVFLPLLVTVPWSLWYLWKHYANWNWLAHGSLLLLLGVLSSPYSWFTDETLVIPALLPVLLLRGWRFRVYAGLNALLILMVVGRLPLASGLYAWSAVLWLGLMLPSWCQHDRKDLLRPECCSEARPISQLL